MGDIRRYATRASSVRNAVLKLALLVCEGSAWDISSWQQRSLISGLPSLCPARSVSSSMSRLETWKVSSTLRDTSLFPLMRKFVERRLSSLIKIESGE